jgi:hypothetical protein
VDDDVSGPEGGGSSGVASYILQGGAVSGSQGWVPRARPGASFCIWMVVVVVVVNGDGNGEL